MAAEMAAPEQEELKLIEERAGDMLASMATAHGLASTTGWEAERMTETSPNPRTRTEDRRRFRIQTELPRSRDEGQVRNSVFGLPSDFGHRGFGFQPLVLTRTPKAPRADRALLSSPHRTGGLQIGS